MELNQLLLDLNLDDVMAKNDLTVNDLNEIEKSILTDKSMAINPLFQNSKKNITQKKLLPNNNLIRFKTVNSDFDKKQKKRLSLGGIYVQNQKDKLSSLKNRFKKGNGFSNSIIYVNQNKDNFLNLESIGSNNPFFSNKKMKQTKMVHFADDIISNKSSKNTMESNNFPSMKKKCNSDLLYTEEKESKKKPTIIIKKDEKLRKLKEFLIKCKKKLKNKKNEEFRAKRTMPKEKKNEIIPSNFQAKKLNLKVKTNNQTKPDLKYQINLITESEIISNINNIEKSNINNGVEKTFFKLKSNDLLNESNDSLIKDLNDICNEEHNFSFLSIGNFNNYLDLSVSNDINFEILSSYDNINQISKGKYIFDFQAQNKFKLKIKKYFIKELKKEKELTLSLKSLDFSSNSKGNSKTKKEKSKNSKKTFGEKGKKIGKKSKKRLNIVHPKSHIIIQKHNEETKVKQNDKKPEYGTEIKLKINKKFISSKKDNESNKKTNFNNKTNNSTNQNNFTFKTSLENMNEKNSIKVNASSNDNNSICFSKSVTRKLCLNDSLDINIKKNKLIYNESEAEYEINPTFSKSNIIFKNKPINYEKIDKNSNKNIDVIKKIRKGINKNIKKKERKIINQLFGIKLPNTNVLANNITTTSSKNFDNKDKDNFNSNEKINNIEASFSIYNIIQKNINKNLKIIDNKENIGQNNMNKSFCNIY